MFDRYSILDILAGDVHVRFVNLFRSILPVVPTECDVLIVSRQHNDQKRKFKEQHAKMWENIAGRRDTLAPAVSTLRGLAPPSPTAVPTPLSLHTATACHKYCEFFYRH